MTQRRKKKQQRNSKGETVAHSSSHANSIFSDGEADEEETKDVQRKDEPIQQINHSGADLFIDSYDSYGSCVLLN